MSQSDKETKYSEEPCHFCVDTGSAISPSFLTPSLSARMTCRVQEMHHIVLYMLIWVCVRYLVCCETRQHLGVSGPIWCWAL